MLSQVAFNDEEHLYVPTKLSEMRTGRGCFSACYHDDYIYVIGGMTMNEHALSSCENYCIDKDTWYEIAPMNVARKNSSVCALTADTLYVIGGTCNNGHMTATIEQYLISANLWILLQVKLSNPISFATTFKVSPF